MDWLNSLWDTGEKLLGNLKYLINPVGAAGSDAVVKLKATASAWLNDYYTLREIPDSQLSPELIREKRRLLIQGQYVIDKIKLIGFGSDFITRQLGALPLIPIAVIVSAAGLMYYWTIDYQKFKTRAAEYRSLRDSGLTHSQAEATIKTIDSQGGIFADLQGITKYATIGGGLFLAYLMFNK